MCRPTLGPSSMGAKDNELAKESSSKMPPPSGFEKRKFLVEAGLVTLAVVYGCVYCVNPNLPVLSSYCKEEQEQNGKQEESCLRPDLIAYQVTSLLAMTTMGCMGVYNWHFGTTAQSLAKGTAEDRLFGHVPEADYQNVAILCYQLWDLVVSLTIPEHMDPIFLTHHILAAITAYCSLEYQMVPYYSIYYGGCSEFSSVFLIFIGQELFPVEEDSLWDKWLLVCKVMFFITFSAYRIFGWIYYSFPLWKDCQTVIQNGSLDHHRPGKALFLRLFQGLDLLLGALQCYWYYEILNAVADLANDN